MRVKSNSAIARLTSFSWLAYLVASAFNWQE